MNEIEPLTTEAHHPASYDLDKRSPEQLVELFLSEDATIVKAVRQEKDAIAAAIRVVARVLAKGGRLFYLGAGTSGRLGVLDASECPPTFSSDPGQVIGLIAGGDQALKNAIEGAEDNGNSAIEDLQAHQFSKLDVLVGIATSGRTPYVIHGLEYAKSLDAPTVGISCNQQNLLAAHSDILICPVVGPELISGSTRMKSGTATKMILNMLTTGAMIQNGKTYGNRMVDLTATNQKLTQRSINLLREFTGLSATDAEVQLEKAKGQLKVAIVATMIGNRFDEAILLLENANGVLRKALELAGVSPPDLNAMPPGASDE